MTEASTPELHHLDILGYRALRLQAALRDLSLQPFSLKNYELALDKVKWCEDALNEITRSYNLLKSKIKEINDDILNLRAEVQSINPIVSGSDMPDNSIVRAKSLNLALLLKTAMLSTMVEKDGEIRLALWKLDCEWNLGTPKLMCVSFPLESTELIANDTFFCLCSSLSKDFYLSDFEQWWKLKWQNTIIPRSVVMDKSCLFYLTKNSNRSYVNMHSRRFK